MSETELAPAAESSLTTSGTAPTEQPAQTSPTESKSEGEAPAEGEKKEESSKPLTVEDLKAPEGAEIDKAAAEGFINLANEMGIKGEAAQKLFDYGSNLLNNAAKAQVESFVKVNDQWASECKADKEFGGEKLEQSLAGIAKLLDNPKFADPGLRQALILTGAGNNPAVFRSFAKMAAALNEGNQVSGSPAQVKRPESLGQALYGDK